MRTTPLPPRIDLRPRLRPLSLDQGAKPTREVEAPKMHRVLPTPAELTTATAARLRPEGCNDGASEGTSEERVGTEKPRYES